MESPSHVAGDQPWSPVGYRVVPVNDQNTPLPAAPRQPNKQHKESWSLGYEAVVLANPTEPAASSAVLTPTESGQGGLPKARRASIEPDHKNPLAFWIPAGLGGACLLAAIIGMMIASAPEPIPREPMPNGLEVVIPKEMIAAAKAAPAPAKKEVDANRKQKDVPAEKVNEQQKNADGGEAAPQCERDTFNTEVGFARNPQQALRVAQKEDKLAFMLHVSGHFEDAGFT